MMSSATQKTTINAWNEWDPLMHVIVGRVDKTMTVPAEKEKPSSFPHTKS